jgi:hypothetical protein
VTELEWQACKDPEQMVRAIPAERYQRELRLFCAVCVRRVWKLLPEECRRAVEVAERFARGSASHAELCAACDAADPVILAVWSGGRSPDARAYATNAAGDAAGEYPRTPATVLSATSEAASAVGCAAGEADELNYDAVFDAARATELSWQAALLRSMVPYPGDSAAT